MSDPGPNQAVAQRFTEVIDDGGDLSVPRVIAYPRHREPRASSGGLALAEGKTLLQTSRSGFERSSALTLTRPGFRPAADRRRRRTRSEKSGRSQRSEAEHQRVVTHAARACRCALLLRLPLRVLLRLLLLVVRPSDRMRSGRRSVQARRDEVRRLQGRSPHGQVGSRRANREDERDGSERNPSETTQAQPPSAGHEGASLPYALERISNVNVNTRQNLTSPRTNGRGRNGCQQGLNSARTRGGGVRVWSIHRQR